MATETGFKNKVVVVTGGGGGLGAAFCRRFCRAGARVAALDRQGQAARELAAELEGAGGQALGLDCDVTDPRACRQALQEVARRWGRVDVLINNAGITHRSPFVETSLEVYRRVMEVNFFGALNCTRAALDYLCQSRGFILVISSVAGFAPLWERTGYSASKHALHGFFDSLRGELEPLGVGVGLVCPSFADTGIEKNALDGQGRPAQHPRSSTGRIASAQEVAEAVFQAAAARKRLSVLSPVGKASWWISRICPGLYERLMLRRIRGGVPPLP